MSMLIISCKEVEKIKMLNKTRPPVWKLVREAVEALNGEATYQDIKEYIWGKYSDIKERTINCQIIICCVNQKSRVYYPPNRKPRESTGKYDFLYNLGNGRVTIYQPEKHGYWGIIEDRGRLTVTRLDRPPGAIPERQIIESKKAPYLMYKKQPMDSQQIREIHDKEQLLKEVLYANLNLLGKNLRVYQDASGRTGFGYPTEAGLVDILAVDGQGRLVCVDIFEKLTLERLAQVLARVGWVQKQLQANNAVRCMLVAGEIDEQVQLSLAALPQVEVYQISFSIRLDRLTA